MLIRRFCDDRLQVRSSELCNKKMGGTHIDLPADAFHQSKNIFDLGQDGQVQINYTHLRLPVVYASLSDHYLC